MLKYERDWLVVFGRIADALEKIEKRGRPTPMRMARGWHFSVLPAWARKTAKTKEVKR